MFLFAADQQNNTAHFQSCPLYLYPLQHSSPPYFMIRFSNLTLKMAFRDGNARRMFCFFSFLDKANLLLRHSSSRIWHFLSVLGCFGGTLNSFMHTVPAQKELKVR